MRTLLKHVKINEYLKTDQNKKGSSPRRYYISETIYFCPRECLQIQRHPKGISKERWNGLSLRDRTEMKKFSKKVVYELRRLETESVSWT